MNCEHCESLRREYATARERLRTAVQALETDTPDVAALARVEDLRLAFSGARDALEQHLATHQPTPRRS